MLLIMVALVYAKKDDQTVVIHSFGKFPHFFFSQLMTNGASLKAMTMHCQQQ